MHVLDGRSERQLGMEQSGLEMLAIGPSPATGGGHITRQAAPELAKGM